MPVSRETRLLPLLPHSVELHCLFLGSFAAPGVAPQGCTPAPSSVSGICSSQRHPIAPPGHKAQVRLGAGCFSSSRNAGDSQCAIKLISAVLHGQRLQCTLGQAEGVCAALSALWAIGFDAFVLVLGALKLNLLYHQIAVHKRSEEAVGSVFLLGRQECFQPSEQITAKPLLK